MGLSAALSIANSGLSSVNTQFSLLSQNVANASTPGYVVESASQTNLTAEADGLGVRTNPATLNIDQTLQSSAIQQNTVVSGLQTTQSALQAIDSVLGTPGSGYDLGSLLGNLQNSFSTLLTDPSSQVQQSAVVNTASTLAQGINSLSAAYTAQGQAAQTALQTDVNTLNTTLATIGGLNTQIVTLQAQGQSTADLQNQRNQAVQTLSGLMQVNTVEQSNGDLSVFTASGLSIPVDGAPATFAIAPATVSAENYYPGGGLPGITMNGTDVTSQLVGGSIGANVTLRDQTFPTDQAELDEFSYNLANRFSAQGLTLFTDGSGNVPAGGGTPTQSTYLGFSAEIQVNPAVLAIPSLVRDGTDAIAGSSTGAAAFTPNPSGGPSGFGTLISNVLNYTFGTQAQSGVPQPDMATSDLGPAGTLTAPFSGSGAALSDYATDLVSSQAQQSATTTSTLSTEQTLQTNLNAKVASVSGVNMDTEMSQMIALQNAYGANAKIVTTIQSMFQDIMGIVQMSGAVGGITSYGMMPQLIANAGTVHAELDALTEQASTGLISQTYAGLGSGASISLDLSPTISALQTYNTNIDQVTGQLGVAQTALTQIQQIGSTFLSDLPNLNGLNPQEIDSVAAGAQSALTQVADLLDTQDAGVYVFAGQDTSNPPVPDPDQILTSGFYTQINQAVSNLAANGGTATAAATLAIAESNDPGTSPFSTYLSQPASSISLPVVQTSVDGMQSVGIVASANTAAVSTGTSTTGSYMRDLMRSLATLGSLSSSQASDAGFAPLVEDTMSSLTSSVDAMGTDVGILGNQQAQLTSVQSQLTSTSNALSTQVSSAQDVDMASTLSQLTSVQTQLQESYRLIVNAATLSLANYLPT